MTANTDWLRDAKWGVFMHYLADTASNLTPLEISSDDWNKRVNGFDVRGLADQLAETGAPYVIVTLGQNSGYYISPNDTYDRILGRKPSRLSKRDLVADLIAALAPKGIKLLVYLPSHAPVLDRQAVESFKCTPRWDASMWSMHPGSYIADPCVDERLTEFQRMWEGVIREWSTRWGGGVHGWWFDGCYYADRMYRHSDEPNFASFAAAAKSGNRDSLVAWNPGVKVPVVSLSEHEDFTAGEIAFDFPTRPVWWEAPQESYRFVGAAQYHILSFLGKWWGQGPLRFSEEFVVGYTKHVNSLEGVITWDVAPTAEGLIQEEFLVQLRKIGEAAR